MGITTKALQLDEIRATSAVEESTQCSSGGMACATTIILAVRQRHQPVVTLGSLRFTLNPTPLQGFLA